MGNNNVSCSQSLPKCTVNKTHISNGERSRGDKFSDTCRIMYTYGGSICCVEIEEKGKAKRTERVRISVVDKDGNGNDDVVFDGEVMATEGGSGMKVRNCKGGFTENWCYSGHRVQAIRYYGSHRCGMFALNTGFGNCNNVDHDDEVVVQHYYATRSNNKGGGFVVEVKIKYDKTLNNGYIVGIEGPRAIRDNNEKGTDSEESEGEGKLKKVIIKGVDHNYQLGRNGILMNNPLGESYVNSGYQLTKGVINSNGPVKGVGNNSIFLYYVNFWRNRLDSTGSLMQDQGEVPDSALRDMVLAFLSKLVGTN